MTGAALFASPVTDEERRQLAEAAEQVGAAPEAVSLRVGPAGRALPLSGPLGRLLHGFLTALAAGEAVWLVPRESELTPRQAAEMIGLSRQSLTRAMDAGHLPFHRVGSHRRLAVADVLAYQRERTARRAALVSLTQLSDDLGLYDR